MFVPDKPTLQSLVGREIIARIPIVYEQGPTTVKLVSVDHAGIWIESKHMTEYWLSELKVSATASTFVFFVPYHQLYWVLALQERVSLSEKGLGVEDDEPQT